MLSLEPRGVTEVVAASGERESPPGPTARRILPFAGGRPGIRGGDIPVQQGEERFRGPIGRRRLAQGQQLAERHLRRAPGRGVERALVGASPTAALRLWRATGDEEFGDAARIVGDAAFCKWTVLPSVVDGLTGLGEYMLDMHLATGDAVYESRAREIAETLLWYGMPRETGMAFPGRWLSRVSTDYAYGSAGVGLFLDRLLRHGGRLLVDFNPSEALASLAAGAEGPAGGLLALRG